MPARGASVADGLRAAIRVGNRENGYPRGCSRRLSFVGRSLRALGDLIQLLRETGADPARLIANLPVALWFADIGWLAS
jgi:hypothetical protein